MKQNKLKTIVLVIIAVLVISVSSVIISFDNSYEEENPMEIHASAVYYEDTFGSAQSAYVSGDYAYLGVGTSGLAILDISDPTNPEVVDHMNTDGSSQDIEVRGNYAYLADDTYGLAIIDISDPSNPGSPVYSDTDNAYGLDISGNYAYLSDYFLGLAVIDITDPTNPGSPDYMDTSGEAWKVDVSGDYAYMAVGSAGLAVIDISDPTNPGSPSYEDSSGSAYDIFVSGDYAYVADGDYGLAIFDISNPTNPTAPVYKDTSGSARAIHISGDYAYLADFTGGLAVINISDPTNPGDPEYKDISSPAFGVYVDGNYAYLGIGSSGLAVIDISENIIPSSPVYEDTNGEALDIKISGDYVYIADRMEGLAVIDISDPSDPGTPVYENTTGDAVGVFISGNYAYLATQVSGLAIMDISDPTDPGTPVYKDTDGYAEDVFISGNYAYIADGSYGLGIIDISDPINPGTLVYMNTGGYAMGIHVSGNYAYVADHTGGLAIINVTDPTNPGTPDIETTIATYDVFVSGDYAYVAYGTSGLGVIDISDPTNPGLPNFISAGNAILDVHVSGNYAYVADGFSGLRIIDISDPTNPTLSNNRDTSGYSNGIDVSGDYAYIADETSGLAVIKVRNRYDISDPALTSTPSDFTIESGYSGITISWTATDANPNTYRVELQGTGIVQGPIAWTSGVAITYNVPDGLPVGEYLYTVNFTDDYDNSISHTVNMTIQDTLDPVITIPADNFTIDLGYTGETISWTATDPNPDTYTVELQGGGIMQGPTAWTSGVEITYDVPDGLPVGEYLYTVNFTDDLDNFETDVVKMTVQDPNNPSVISAPDDYNIDYGYSGETVSWTATDANPNTYTIDLQGTGIVQDPTTWSSGSPVIYNIPDGFAIGDYFYTINFTDDFDNFATDTVQITVNEIDDPLITDSPSDFIVEYDYTGEIITWTATDASPNTYSIDLQGTGIVQGPTAWSSGVAVVYNVPDGLGLGEHFYTINYTDIYGRFITDSVKMTVQDTTNPVISISPTDITLETGYTSETFSWTATDFNPNTYTIDLQGTGIVQGPTGWFSGLTFVYNIPDGLSVGEYYYTVNISDGTGNFVTDTVKLTVRNPTPTTPSIPGYELLLLVSILSVIGVLIIFKKKFNIN